MPTRWLSVCVGAWSLAVFLASPANAQMPIPQGEFSVMRYSPAVGPGNYFQVEGAQTPGHIQGSAGVVIDYAHLPFVLWNAECPGMDASECMVGDTRSELVQYVAAAHITGTFTLFDRIQIGAVLPLALSSGEGFADPSGGGDVLAGGDAFVLADPRLSVKGRLFTDASSGFSLAASAFVTFPTGQAIAQERFLGDSVPSFGGQIIAEIVISGFHASLNLGGTWREETDIFSTHVGPQLTYGVGLGYDITSMIGLFGEIIGASAFSSQLDEHWLEWRLGGRLRIDDVDITLGAGTGLPPFGVGTPLARVLAGVQWAPMHADSDGDGVEDSDDSCPTEAEDQDGWEDEDGCPEADNDDDGHPDAHDPCRDEAEDMDGFEDEDGCPDNDNDEDGIRDGYDSCPNQAEDMDGDRDEDGCPDNDSDRDGIEDADDQCPNEEEDFDGFADEDGCPEEDADNDGVPDVDDACPGEAEDQDGHEDEDGCPEEGGPARGRRGGR